MPKIVVKTKNKIDQKRLAVALEKDLKRKVDLKNLKKSHLEEIGKDYIAEIKARIARGISPLYGNRFPAYKNPKRYPGKRKPKRPVNLKLTGDFLKSLIVKVTTGSRPILTITFNKPKSFDKERGHREGANTQPKRPIIPNNRETFSRGLLIEFDKILNKVLNKVLK